MSTHVRKLLVLLLLGVATNYVVAWSLVVNNVSQRYGEFDWHVGGVRTGAAVVNQRLEYAGFPVTRVRGGGFCQISIGAAPYFMCGNERDGHETPAHVLVARTPAQQLFDDLLDHKIAPDALPRDTSWTMTGWPMLSLYARHHPPPFNSLRTPVVTDAVVFPWIPVWPGFGVNSLVWAAAWAAAVWSVLAVRSSIRRSAGCCANCGYQVRHNAFGRGPECGAAIPGSDMAPRVKPGG